MTSSTTSAFQSPLELVCGRVVDSRGPRGPNRFYEPSKRLLRTSCPGRPASLKRPGGRTSCYPSPSWFLSAALGRGLRRNESVAFGAQFKATAKLHQANATRPTVLDSQRVTQLRRFGTGGKRGGTSGIFGDLRGHDRFRRLTTAEIVLVGGLAYPKSGPTAGGLKTWCCSGGTSP
jgi:hypothetical protein